MKTRFLKQALPKTGTNGSWWCGSSRVALPAARPPPFLLHTPSLTSLTAFLAAAPTTTFPPRMDPSARGSFAGKSLLCSYEYYCEKLGCEHEIICMLRPHVPTVQVGVSHAMLRGCGACCGLREWEWPAPHPQARSRVTVRCIGCAGMPDSHVPSCVLSRGHFQLHAWKATGNDGTQPA